MAAALEEEEEVALLRDAAVRIRKAAARRPVVRALAAEIRCIVDEIERAGQGLPPAVAPLPVRPRPAPGAGS